jgi:Ran GTPase-activating protein (RanGAP) involved in mRNA processing and transport
LGASAIAEALKVNSSLQVLSVSSNNIGDSGAVAIARALCQNSMLQKLDVRGSIVKHAGAEAFESNNLKFHFYDWQGIFQTYCLKR